MEWIVDYHYIGKDNMRHYRRLSFKTKTEAENKAAELNIKCPKCKEGDIVARKTKRGKIFYGCNRFPKCDFALWDKPVNEFCPKCDSILVEKNKKTIKCSNKECDFIKDAA